MPSHLLETEQKALEINLDAGIYGSFAEIGAGQEVAQYFFKVGAAAGTIAKTMSAYDKTVSDSIYGAEQGGRYVCESRLYRMLDHEFELMIDRLTDERPNTCMFAFADTVATLNYHKTNKAHGWMGLRFQLVPNGEPNDIVIHIEMLDNNTALQQQAIGVLGVNMIYACYRFHKDYRQLLASLMDKLRDRINIDLISLTGPQFSDMDNRVLLLELVKQGMTKTAMFDKKGKPIHPSEFLYKNHLLLVRGSYHPVTLVNLDMLQTASTQFKAETNEPRKTHVAAEITLPNLMVETGEVSDEDFIDRVDLLNHIGQMVLISNCSKYSDLVNYFEDYRVANLGIVIGARQLLELFTDSYYKNKDGQLLSSFGEVLRSDVRLYVYPAQKEGSGELLTSSNLPVPDGMRHLYRHILDHKHVVDLTGFNEKNLHIYSQEVLRMLRIDEDGWDKMVTPKIAEFIRNKGLFGFPCQSQTFEY